MILIAFIFPLLIIITFILLSNVLFRRFQGKTPRSVYMRFSIYAGIILVSMLLVTFIPQEISLEKDENIEVEHFPNFYAMMDADYNETWDEDLVKDYVVSQKSFDLTGDQLIVDPITEDNMFYPNEMAHDTFIEQTEDLEGAIEVILFQTPTVFGQYNITELLPTFKVEFEKERLQIFSQATNLDITSQLLPYPMRLFKKDATKMMEELLWGGERVVYIKAPKNIEIIFTDYEN